HLRFPGIAQRHRRPWPFGVLPQNLCGIADLLSCVTEMLQDVSVARIVGPLVNNNKYIVMMLGITACYER
ncbi:hypothetical protein, partial [Pseudomonas plecoglossicida]|uniref:hypothetical protein n=1 Tax=Pseudomonas plecoglossicida TaxID=70775 RepID=UPI0019D446CF